MFHSRTFITLANSRLSIIRQWSSNGSVDRFLVFFLRDLLGAKKLELLRFYLCLEKVSGQLPR